MIRYMGIDPSTKTGVVVLDKDGQVVYEDEITATGKDPQRMYDLIDCIKNTIDFHQKTGDLIITIEDFAYSQGNKMALLGGIGWGIRLAAYELGFDYINVGTGQLKKFSGAKGNAGKDKVRLEVYKRWGYEHDSDNVIDAYVLAQIARSKDGHGEITKFQEEVLKKVGS